VGLFTEDYLMRIINQALGALMIAVGLRKSGKYSEALQAIQQAVEQLTTLPANLVDQMDDGNLISLLSAQGQLDVGRLAILADLYQEQGEILVKMDQTAQASTAFARALRFFLEVALSESSDLSNQNITKVHAVVQRLQGYPLPVETQLALSDYYQRLLEKDDQGLLTAGTSREQVSRLLEELQDQLGRS
jgi:tetratricopeptide (TPR) repeat protein